VPRPRHADRRPDPEPLEADEPKVVAVGTVLFTVALLVLLLVRERLEAAGTEWLIGSSVTGIVLGLVGLVYTRRRRDALVRRRTPERDAVQPELPVSQPHRAPDRTAGA
jgi:hypothetical protein